jgi:hypothetical protein
MGIERLGQDPEVAKGGERIGNRNAGTVVSSILNIVLNESNMPRITTLHYECILPLVASTILFNPLNLSSRVSPRYKLATGHA